MNVQQVAIVRPRVRVGLTQAQHNDAGKIIYTTWGELPTNSNQINLIYNHNDETETRLIREKVTCIAA